MASKCPCRPTVLWNTAKLSPAGLLGIRPNPPESDPRPNPSEPHPKYYFASYDVEYLSYVCEALLHAGDTAHATGRAVPPDQGRTVHVDPFKPTMKAPGTKRLKLKMLIRFQTLL